MANSLSSWGFRNDWSQLAPGASELTPFPGLHSARPRSHVPSSRAVRCWSIQSQIQDLGLDSVEQVFSSQGVHSRRPEAVLANCRQRSLPIDAVGAGISFEYRGSSHRHTHCTSGLTISLAGIQQLTASTSAVTAVSFLPSSACESRVTSEWLLVSSRLYEANSRALRHQDWNQLDSCSVHSSRGPIAECGTQSPGSPAVVSAHRTVCVSVLNDVLNSHLGLEGSGVS